MSQTKQVRLNTSSILSVPLQTYEKDFSFIVNGKEFKTSRFISDLLSPIICRLHLNDPTIDSFIINTENQGDFSHILNLHNFEPATFSASELPFLSEVISKLGNGSIEYESEESGIEISVDNVLRLLREQEGSGLFYSKEISREIEFASSHFSEVCESGIEELKNLSVETVMNIMSNDELRLKNEDELLKIINCLYSNDCKYSILYETVLFSNVTVCMMKEFLDLFDSKDMTVFLWKRLSCRLCGVIENPVMSEESLGRYLESPKNESVTKFEYTDDKVFKGIFNHLQTQTGGKIENEISFTASSVNSGDNFQPKNVALFGDQNNYFHSLNEENSWICFDFKDRRVVPTHYTVKSVNWGVNNHHPKSWQIEGSIDNSSWETIDEEKNCTFLNGKSHVHTFAMNHPTSTEFRYIRMRQTDKNWCGCNYLIFDSFEIYGRLI